jgi:hypothetical protein
MKSKTISDGRKKLTEEQAEELFTAALRWMMAGGRRAERPSERLLKVIKKLDRVTTRVLRTGEVPKVGEDIYLKTSWYLSHGADDFTGGRCEVTKVTWDEAQKAHFIEVAEDPGSRIRWEGHLKEMQPKLEKEFGNRRGHPDPDNHPDANRWD